MFGAVDSGAELLLGSASFTVGEDRVFVFAVSASDSAECASVLDAPELAVAAGFTLLL